MGSLLNRRCLNHGIREAVARCLECREFFCRECIAEHEGRVVCASCLGILAAPVSKPVRSGWWTGLGWGTGAVAGLLVAWLGFYFLGKTLLSIPSDFHARSLWKGSWLPGSESAGDE